MRYHITRFFSHTMTPITREQASNRAAAEEVFETARNMARPGQTVRLTDTSKSNEILETYYQPTADEIIADRERHIDEYIARLCDSHEAVEKFASALVKANDPADRFGWADRAIEAACETTVGRFLRDCRKHVEDEKEITLEQIVDMLRHKVIDGARCPKRSTSAISNFVETEMLAQWTRTYERLDGYLADSNERLETTLADALRDDSNTGA